MTTSARLVHADRSRCMQVLAHEAGPVLLVLLAGVRGSLQVGAVAALELRLEEAGGVVVEEGVPNVAVLQRPDHLHALQGMRQLQGNASVADEHYPPRALQPLGQVLDRVLVPQDDDVWSLGNPLHRADHPCAPGYPWCSMLQAEMN